MSCPSCSFARTFARRTAVPSIPTKRAFSSTSAALQEADASSPPAQKSTQQSANPPLLHITKTKVGHGPSNPNARPPPPSHGNIVQRLGVRFARPVPGAQEWRTSTYSYNKATVKTLPTAAQTADNLLEYYSVLKNTGGRPSSRTALALRRKSPEQVYVSQAGIKDFGDKIRIDAYMYDESKTKQEQLKARFKARDAKAAEGDGGRRRAPGRRPPPPARG